MPDKKKKAKARHWFSVQFWFRVFQDTLEGNPKKAENLMALMGSLREMIEETKPGRRAASLAIQNAITACGRYTWAQVLAEWAERKQAKKRTKKKDRKKAKRDRASLPNGSPLALSVPSEAEGDR